MPDKMNDIQLEMIIHWTNLASLSMCNKITIIVANYEDWKVGMPQVMKIEMTASQDCLITG